MALHPVAALDLPVASRERVSSGLSCSKPRWLSSKRHRVSESPGARAWPGQLTCYWEGNPVSHTSVLLTGASGFVGRHVLTQLLDRQTRTAELRIHATTRQDLDTSDLPASNRTAWHRIDLADAGAVARLIDDTRPDVVLHLASHVAGSRDIALVRPTFDGNAASTVHLLTALQEQRAAGGGCRRFVQVGSLEEPEPGDPAAPSSPYAAAKAAATQYGRMFHHLYDFPITFARVFMVYGPGRQDENKLVPYTFRQLLAGEAPSFGSGTRPVDWVFVRDVAEGLIRMGFADGLDGKRVDLGSGDLHTVRHVVEEMFRLVTPATTPSFGGRADRKDEQVRRADIDVTQRLLGWSPTVDLDEGLRQTADWFRDN